MQGVVALGENRIVEISGDVPKSWVMGLEGGGGAKLVGGTKEERVDGRPLEEGVGEWVETSLCVSWLSV